LAQLHTFRGNSIWTSMTHRDSCSSGWRHSMNKLD